MSLNEATHTREEQVIYNIQHKSLKSESKASINVLGIYGVVQTFCQIGVIHSATAGTLGVTLNQKEGMLQGRSFLDGNPWVHLNHLVCPHFSCSIPLKNRAVNVIPRVHPSQLLQMIPQCAAAHKVFDSFPFHQQIQYLPILPRFFVSVHPKFQLTSSVWILHIFSLNSYFNTKTTYIV